jgi:cytochrome c peroxidase
MAIISVALGLASMMQLSVDLSDNELRAMLSLSPPEFPAPRLKSTNKYGDDPRAVALGEKLFFLEGLGGVGTTQSCASCHNPNSGWADGIQFATGDGVGTLNTPTVRNSAFNNFLFWDGRADSLWAQAAQPLESPIEMHGSRYGVLRTISTDEKLLNEWQGIFGKMPAIAQDLTRPPHAAPNEEFGDAWISLGKDGQLAINEAFVKTLKAIAAFERTVISEKSNFDLFVEGLRTDEAELIKRLSPQAQRGMKIFVGEANCISCHFGPLLSDGQFHNIGLEPYQDIPAVIGRPDGIEKVRLDLFNGRNRFSDDASWKANGQMLYMISNEHTVGAVKTPSLRDVATTAPYMHDGRFATLEEVVEFYSLLPGFPGVGHREETLSRLLLSDEQLAELVAFMKSLSSL